APTDVRSIGGTTYSASLTVSYTTIQITPTITGTYTLNGCGSGDTHMQLYQGTFTPGTPATNFVEANDDGNTSICTSDPRITRSLTGGQTYILVYTPFSGTAGVTGITIAVTPPVGGNMQVGPLSSVEWYTVASGGSPVGSGSPFNPVPSVLANTNTPLLPYYMPHVQAIVLVVLLLTL
ncbi:MAG: hypothetical protein IPO27_15645, partial [Bacteroidetes bacterium]|nr:hypothetical protein [Bacteroidota bacterium]